MALSRPVCLRFVWTRHHGAMPTFDDALRCIDDRFALLREEKRIPGIAWGVIRDGELVHAGGVGDGP